MFGGKFIFFKMGTTILTLSVLLCVCRQLRDFCQLGSLRLDLAGQREETLCLAVSADQIRQGEHQKQDLGSLFGGCQMESGEFTLVFMAFVCLRMPLS